MGPSSQIRRTADRVSRLADWLTKFKPDCKQMSIEQRDFSVILANPGVARPHGFAVTGESITFRGFAIRSTQCKAERDDIETAMEEAAI